MPTAADPVTASDRPPVRTLRYPCSPAQRRFWVLDQLDPGDSSLNVAVRWRIRGRLDDAELEEAFRRIVARHETLRTYFVVEDGEPMQMVLPAVAPSVAVVDLSGSAPEEAERFGLEIAEAEAHKPFRLTAPPLLRVTRLRLAPDDSILLLTAHHIVCDGWSVGLIAAEMGEICDALQTGRAPVLPALEVSYGDYSSWMREWMESDELEADRAYWEPKLAGSDYFELPSDLPRPPVWANDSAIASRLLPRSRTDALARLAMERGCTLYMLALAALLTLLHRYSGETDIAVGTQVAGRGEVETEPLVGPFINTLVLRTDLAGDPEFLELLERVRRVAGEAFEHEYMPIEVLIEILKPRRDFSRNPLFAINFIYQRSFVENRKYSHFQLIDLPSRSAGALYDLNFFMVERPEGWRFSCEFNTSLFLPATVERLLDHYDRLLLAVAAAPRTRLSGLGMMDEGERQSLLAECNASARDYPADRTLPELFAERVARAPDAVAVVGAGEQLSYRELDRASNRLARTLLQRGWGPGERVGVFLDRSPQLVVALLAVLKAGSAYVPLDPRYPAERLAHVASDARMAGVLTNAAMSPGVAGMGAPTLVLDGDDALAADDGPLPVRAGPMDKAYVMYTSGSTGLPKGVPIHHRALTNFLCAMQAEPGLGEADTLLAVTTIAFDIAALEIFLPLVCGARLIMADEDDVVDGKRLRVLLDRHRVSVLQATPVTWRMLLDAGWQPGPGLRMLCGGEALPRALADRLLENAGELWNMYGPTETTIWSSVLRVTAGRDAVPLGPPIANTRFHVLDQRLQLVPMGVPGELYIGGDGVARGYFERPDLTRERFLPDPYSAESGALLYRTGDRVRRRPDGSLEFLGRMDFQTKLRGYRIELGEIESVLASDERVKEAVVVLGKTIAGDDTLWAYVAKVPGDTGLGLVEALRRRLSARLPAYMQPSAITLLDALPRTPNGKLDRKALPAPLQSSGRGPSAPLGKVERYLADLWRELLEWPGDIDAESNFFELGGHSISAARMLARVEKESGQRISLAQLFRLPSLGQVADLIRAAAGDGDPFQQVLGSAAPGAPMTWFALHNAAAFFHVARRLGGGVSFVFLQLFDPEHRTEHPPATLEAMAAGYVELILRAQPEGRYHLVGWCISGVLAYETARQLSSRGLDVDLVLLDSWAPDYIARMPRLRGKLLQLYHHFLAKSGELHRLLARKISLREWLQRRWLILRNRIWHRLILRQTLRDKVPSAPASDTGNHGEWLFVLLQELVRRYEVKPFQGTVLVLRSRTEPKSRLLDPSMGWSAFAPRARIAEVEGDHWTILREPGAGQIAGYLSAAREHGGGHAQP